MKQKFVLLVLLSGFVTANVFANRQIIDSLKNEVHSAIRQNAGKETMVELYQQLSAWYEGLNEDSVTYFLKKALAYYPKPDYQDIGYLYLLGIQANRYFYQGDLIKTKQTFQTIYNHAVKLPEKQYDLEANALSLIALCYRRLGQRDSAIYYYNKAIKLGQEFNDQACLALLYNNIGVMYHNDKAFEKALENGEKAAEYARQAQDIVLEVGAYSLQGMALCNMDRTEQGRNILRKGIHLGIREEFPELVMKCLSPLINSYLKEKNNDSILHYLKLGEKYAQGLPPGSPATLGFYESEVSAYLLLKMYHRSIECLKNTPGLSTQISQDKFHYLMAQNYQGLKQPSKALEHMQLAYEYKDSVFNSQLAEKMSELQARLNLNEKELTIARLETETAQQEQNLMKQALFFTSAILLLLILLSVILYKKRIQHKEMELLAAKQYIDGLENERKRLAKDLHDGVCNDLLGLIMNVQQAEATPAEQQQAILQMENIRTNIRHISHELMPPNFQFADLNEILNDYVYKMQKITTIPIQYESSQTEEWNRVPENIAYEIYRIVQETTHNILKHAGASYIRIDIRMEADLLTLNIENDCHKSEQTPGGIGHRTLNDRLKSIQAECETIRGNGKYRLTIRVHI